MLPKTCPQCGLEFTPKAHSTFCSEQCRKAYQSHTVVCKRCNKSFATYRVNQEFCSQGCATGYRRATGITMITKPCEWCGNDFTSKKTKNRRFCGHECASLFLAVERLGENNPLWKGGAPKRRGHNWKKQRKLAINRDNFTCQICGKRQKPHQHHIVDVHHITKYSAFNGDWLSANQLTNLITLCRKCHMKVERHGFPCPRKLL